MPEFYIEPLTDRQQCFKCHTTVTGKKKLSKCSGCHAITYCSRECQVTDRPRHAWNCVPVMVTEIPGKGRGLVAARDIKMGEQIFVDKPVIKICSDVDNLIKNMDQVKIQVNKLPSEAKILFNSLECPEMERAFCCKNEETVMTFQKFSKYLRRKKGKGDLGYFYLSLNLTLINHSCAPNIADLSLPPEDECKIEVRAIKDIAKGDEITMCYLSPMQFWSVGFDAQKRRDEIQDKFSFDCKCHVCSGIVPGQEDIIMALNVLNGSIEVKVYGKTKADWKKNAETMGKIVELHKTLYVGNLVSGMAPAISDWAKMAQLAREKDILRNAMDTYSTLMEDTKLEEVRMAYEKLEENLAKWATQMKLKKNPKKEEIDFFLKNVN